MNHRQNIHILAQVFATADRLGAVIPATLVTEYGKLSRLAEQVQALDLPNDIPAAVLAALEAGNNPATDPGVQVAAVGATVGQHASGIETALALRAFAFLNENIDRLMEPFGKPFDAAAKTLRAAATRLGDVDLNDTSAVLARGGDAAKVWADAHSADKTITDIHQLGQTLKVLLSGGSQIDPRHQALTIADIPPTVFVDQAITGWLTPWEVVRRGYPFSLATPATFRTRVAAIQSEQASRQQAAERAFREGYRRTHGVVVA